MGNLSLRTFFNIFFSFENLIGFNRINSIVILLNAQNQLKELDGVLKASDTRNYIHRQSSRPLSIQMFTCW